MGELGLADLRRRQGRLEEAAKLFEPLAAAPQATLGLAAIALESGVPSEAERLARRALRQFAHGNHTARAAALELIVLAAAAGGRAETGRPELAELEALAAGVESEAIRASALLAAAAARPQEARIALEEAAAGFERAGAPYDVLRARLQLAEVLQTEGALEAAASEAGAVARRARELGARSLEQRAVALGGALKTKSDGPGSLTPREQEVLALVAQGLTNRRIATRLGVSEHTVHRHVANIFTRLGLSSRAAAVAFGLRHGIG
jgi:DNA-binding NarL/FixJ family response regulator